MRKKHLQEEPLIKKKVPVQPIIPELPVQLKRTSTSVSPRRMKAKKQLEKRILDSLSTMQSVIPDFVFCDLNEDSRKWQFKDLVFKLNLGEPCNRETAERMSQYFHDYNQKRITGPSSEKLVFQFDSDNDDIECQEDKTKFDDEPLVFQEDWRNLKDIEQVSPREEIQKEPQIIRLIRYQRGQIITKKENYDEAEKDNYNKDNSNKDNSNKENFQQEKEQDFEIKIEI